MTITVTDMVLLTAEPGRSVDHVAAFNVDVRGIRVAGCILACTADGHYLVYGPSLKFRKDKRPRCFVAFTDEDLREAVTRAAVEAYRSRRQNAA